MRLMAGMSTVPSAAASATAEPDISAKNMLVTMETWASPPRMKPTSALAKSTSRLEIPEWFMICPARMNSGMATMGKLSAPLNMRRGRSRRELWPLNTCPTRVPMARANPMGIPRRMSRATARPLMPAARLTAPPPPRRPPQRPGPSGQPHPPARVPHARARRPALRPPQAPVRPRLRPCARPSRTCGPAPTP